MASLFISHSSKDKGFVRRLSARLRADGHSIWLDEAEMRVGDSLVEKISAGIERVDFVGFVISHNSISSPWVAKELSLAMAKELAVRRVVVLPIVIDACKLPESIKDKLFADFRNPSTFDWDVGQVLDAMVSQPTRDLGVTATNAADGDRTAGAEISRFNPTLLVFLLDESTSMSEVMSGARGENKAAALADCVNRMLTDLVVRCSKGDLIRDYFHIAVLGYGSEAGHVQPALQGELAAREICTISEIGEKPARLERHRRMVENGAGGLVETEYRVPVWVDPILGSDAPMCRALRKAHALVSRWILDGHEGAFPPIVFNLTDDAATDGDPRLAANNLKRLATKWGNVFLFNCCLSYVGGPAVLYPEEAADLPDDYGKALFEMSSRVPTAIRRGLEASGLRVGSKARGFANQATFADLFHFIDIGTRPAVLR